MNKDICLAGILRRSLFIPLMVLVWTLTCVSSAGAAQTVTLKKQNWWQVTPEAEVPSPHYDSILYSEIAPKLKEIQSRSRGRVQVRVMGQSAGNRDLYLVTIAAPGQSGRFGHYKRLRKLMITNPDRAMQRLGSYNRFKIPVFINSSIHGTEYPGADACMRLIEYLAYSNAPEVQTLLDNMILLINVVQNPDGRVLGTRANASGFDLNRDMITQSQPETRALVKVINEWNPMVYLDLHGFVKPMLIEPCTPPHNPNYEYDLYLKWALSLADAMAAKVVADNPSFDAPMIPYRELEDGWDDWAPIYTPMYAMLHAAIGHTLETPYRDERGVDALYSAVWGALNLVAANKIDMVKDQIESYRRGALDLPQVLIPEALLGETGHEQYNNLTIQEFPEAYLIPADKPLQKSPVQAAEFINFLLDNGVSVEKARRGFTHQDHLFPAGTYVVWMDQAKRSLANAFLEDGLDVSPLQGITFYSPPAAWSQPLLWGVSRWRAEAPFSISTRPVKKADFPEGSVEPGAAGAYAVVPDTLQGFRAVNLAIRAGQTFFRTTTPFEDGGRSFAAGTIVFAGDTHLAQALKNDALMEVKVLSQLPVQCLTQMREQRIAILGDFSLAHALEQLGFAFDQFTGDQLNQGADLTGYDLFMLVDQWWDRRLEAGAISNIMDFINNGGDYIGIGEGGNSFAWAQSIFSGLGLTPDWAEGNGIVNINLDTAHPLNSGFQSKDYAFCDTLFWYPSPGEDIQVAGTLDAANILVSGYIPGWEGLLPSDTPVMIHWEDPANPAQDMTFFGFDINFRGHPKQTFKLLGNAIYNGMDHTICPQ